MSKLYEEGRKFFDLEEYKKALEIYSKGDSEGDVYCSLDLAAMLFEGKEVKKDEKRAKLIFARVFPFLQNLAKNGDAQAQEKIAYIYWEGVFVEQNLEEMIKYLIESANGGNAVAQETLGAFYKIGYGVEESREHSVYWYTKAAKNGLSSAQCDLGTMYAMDITDKQSADKALYWLSRSADQNCMDAMKALVKIYIEGNIVKKSYKMAQFWADKIAEIGDGNDKLDVSISYEFGELNRKPNRKKTIYWLKRAIEEGNEAAIIRLADMYRLGIFYEKNARKSFNLYFKVALRNSYASYMVAKYYNKGHAIKKSYKHAIKWYTVSANLGNEFAKYQLGKIYYYGEIIERNYKKANQYFQDLVKRYDDISVQINEEGVFYENIDCTEKIFKEAFYYLGDCYHHGFGVKPDWQKAKQYYQKAIELGYKCEYALDMVKIDLGEYRKVAEMEKYAQSLVKLNLNAETLRERISQDLREDFGESWDNLKENAKVGLITGVLTYITFISMGEEFCKQLDFSAVIVNFAKALEVELAEYFYKGYIRYLKKKGISAAVFPEDACFLNVKKEKGEEISREYQDEKAIKNFKLGGLKHIIDDKFEVMPSLEIAMRSESFLNGRSEAYRKYKNFKGEYGVRTIDKHMLAYANELFSKEAFSSANRKKDIVNYLIDLSNAVGQIAYEYRNPAAHGDVMVKDKASACGDYLIKVRKLIYGFLSKVKKKYRAGYIVDVNKK